MHWEVVPDILEAHEIVRFSGVPNFLNARIPVVTQLKPDRWQYHLRHYWDKQLPDLIRYRFPLDFAGNINYRPHMITIPWLFSIRITLIHIFMRNCNMEL